MKKIVILALSLAAITGITCTTASADTISITKTENLDHSQTASPFFTQNTDGAVNFTASGSGWAPTASAQAGQVASVTTAKSYSIVGNSTSAGNWVDGNGIPAGITLTFNAAFTVSVDSPSGSLLTVPALSGTSLGNGIGITDTAGSVGVIDGSEVLSVSAVSLTSVLFSGTTTEVGYDFTPGTVANFGTRVFRSNDLNEGTEGVLLTTGTDTIGFGLATGTLASNLPINNNYTDGVLPLRLTDPYTLGVTAGAFAVKGIGVAYDVTYDIVQVPEPAVAALGLMGLALLAGLRRKD